MSLACLKGHGCQNKYLESGHSMSQSAVRLSQFVSRFLAAVHNFGLVGAVKALIIYRSRHSTLPVSIYLKRPKRLFYFRGASDRGVVSHFYNEGYHITDEGCESKVGFIIDAGANIGDETVRFRYFHPEAKIVAIEAEKNNFQLLQKNVGKDINLFPVNKGLWSKECGLKIIPGTTNEAFTVSEVETSSQDADLTATTVGSLMTEFGVAEIDILKLDIEGAEKRIFSDGDISWISKVKVYIFECPDDDDPGTAMVIFAALLATGLRYNCYTQGENIILIRPDVKWKLVTDLFFD